MVVFEGKLRDAVGRIDDPQVVASLVRERLAEKVKLYKNLGVYVWNGAMDYLIPTELTWQHLIVPIKVERSRKIWTGEIVKVQKTKTPPYSEGADTKQKPRVI